MYFYQAYGLTFKSVLALPELNVSEKTKADVLIKLQRLPNSPLSIETTAHCYQLTAEGLYIYWQGVGTFLVKNGKEIIIEPVVEVDEDRLRLFLLGAAIGVILHQRGYLVLHGSAVAINEQAVVFIGDKGWGKSTIAATLHARGHCLIGDDVIAIDISKDGKLLVIPAFPQLKLWPDAATSIGVEAEQLPRLVSHLEKRDCRIDCGFAQTALVLEQVYVLGMHDNLAIKSLQPQETMRYLMSNSYVTRFGKELLQTDEASHFLNLMKCANQVSIARLLRPADLSLLSDTAELIENRIEQKSDVIVVQ
jgi:hypothetical protein